MRVGGGDCSEVTFDIAEGWKVQLHFGADCGDTPQPPQRIASLVEVP